MSSNKKHIFKLAIGAILAALTVVVRLVTDFYLASQGMGTPFYAIPLILAGLYLGPLYAVIVGFVADVGMGFGLGNYQPLFLLSTMAWSLIPSLLAKDTKGIRWFLVIYLTYIVAFGFNTMAMFLLGWKKYALANIYLRVGMIPLLGFVVGTISKKIYERLEEASPITI